MVDDDPHTFDRLGFMLTKFGASVRVESSARAAVLACEEHAFDVVISDLSMPHADGYAFLRALRLRPRYLRIPAIAMTRLASQRERALMEGFDLFLVKPVEPAVLCRCVKAVTR